MLIGDTGIEKLKAAHVAVFGLGGVGSYAAEALARSGVGALTLIDGDVFEASNLNRQLCALNSTIGEDKTQATKRRIADINPKIKVNAINTFFLPENADSIDFKEFDYVIDAVDTVTAKLAIIECSKNAGVPVISSMGTGNKTDPTMLKVADISDTKVCPLAKVMRRELKRRNITALPVVYSEETPIKPQFCEKSEHGRHNPGSMAFVPGAAGLILASRAVEHLLNN